MKKLFIKIFGLLVLVAVINVVINHFFYDKRLPFYWGNEKLMNKRDFLYKNKESFNTLFIGSSKFQHQLIPKLFDSLANKGCNCGVHSYNFGIDGMLPPESFNLYRSLLEKDSLPVKTVFLELDFIQEAQFKNLFTWRGYYWVNKKTYKEFSSSYLNSRVDILRKTWNMALLNIMAVQKVYNMGKFNEYVQYKKNITAVDTDYVELNSNGFNGLKHPTAFSPSDLKEINYVKNSSETAFVNRQDWENGKLNNAFETSIKQLMVLAQKKDVRLIFVFPTQWKLYQYKELFPVIKSIPDSNKIVMADYQSHKPLFDLKNMFDSAHVDSTGAVLFTNYMANSYLKIK